jgi:hypothetical protein
MPPALFCFSYFSGLMFLPRSGFRSQSSYQCLLCEPPPLLAYLLRWEGGLINFLPGLASNFDPPDLSPTKYLGLQLCTIMRSLFLRWFQLCCLGWHMCHYAWLGFKAQVSAQFCGFFVYLELHSYHHGCFYNTLTTSKRSPQPSDVTQALIPQPYANLICCLSL